MPITTSQSPVEPRISLPPVAVMPRLLHRARLRCAPIRPQASPSPPAGRPGDTSSRHCRGHPRRGADRRAPRRPRGSPHSSRSCARRPNSPSLPTTVRRAAGSALLLALRPKGWLSDPPYSPPFWRGEAARGLLDHLTEREQRLFVERTADQLQAERQAL